MVLRSAALAAFSTLAACGSPPAEAPRRPEPVGRPVDSRPSPPDAAVLPLWSAVKHGTLPNGLTYYILDHGKPAKRAFLWLAVNAGSILEHDDQRGLAHFDEHMAFNGTKRFPKADIVNYVEKIGMRFGADLDAYTTADQTVYQLEVPTDDPGFLDKGLDILHDWAGSVSYDPVEVDKERGVVLEEWRLGRGAQQRIGDKQQKVLFKGSRYAERITIGLPEIIKGAPRDALYRFYKDWYRPDLMAVIAVGDFDPATLEQEIKARFGDLVNPAHERPRLHGEVPKPEGTQVSIESDPELPGTTVAVYNSLPHRAEATLADFRRITVELVYQTILNERLGVIARRTDAPFAAAGVGTESITREIDMFERFAQARGGKVEDALRSLFTEVLRVERHGFQQSELDRARANLVRSYEQAEAEEASSDSTQYTEEITRNFFEHEFMIGRTAEKTYSLKLLPTITLAELNSVAASFGGASNRSILIAGPDPKLLPAQARVLAIVDEVAHSTVAPWQDKPVDRALMTTAPAPGKIVQQKQLDALGVTEWTLSNGARVVIKPTDFEADVVAITGDAPGGLAIASDAQYNDARFADTVAQLGGVGDFDVEQLGKLLTGKQVQVGASIEETTQSIAGTASTRDLETLFQLVYLHVTAPRSDPGVFKVWQGNASEQLANALHSPEAQFGRQSQVALYGGHARRTPVVAADLQRVDPAKALAFYKDRFADASGFTFVIVGVVDLAKLRPLVETYLASLPAKGRKEHELDRKIRRARGVVKRQWTLGQEPKASVVLQFHGDETWSRDKDRDMFILGQVLSIRLREILREDLGGVYGVGADGSIARTPHQERVFQIRFGCAPDNVDKLLAATFAEIAELQQHGVGADYLEKARSAFLRERETQLRDNTFWANWLASSYRYGDDPAIVLDPSKMTGRMTSDHVKAAAKRYLDRTQYYQAVLLPAAK